MTQQYYTPKEARAHTRLFIMQEAEILRNNLQEIRSTQLIGHTVGYR